MAITELAIWLALVVAGVAILGIIELGRSGTFRGPRWDSIRVAVLATVLITLAVTAGVLAVMWIVVIFIWSLIGTAALVAILITLGVAILLVIGVTVWMAISERRRLPH